MEFHTTDELFATLRVREIRKVLLQTAGDAAARGEGLRNLVGDQYTSLLDTAADASSMLRGVASLAERVTDAQKTAKRLFAMCDPNTQPARRSSELAVQPAAAADAEQARRDWLRSAAEHTLDFLQRAQFFKAACVLVAFERVSRQGAAGPSHVTQRLLAVIRHSIVTASKRAIVHALAGEAEHAAPFLASPSGSSSGSGVEEETRAGGWAERLHTLLSAAAALLLLTAHQRAGSSGMLCSASACGDAVQQLVEGTLLRTAASLLTHITSPPAATAAASAQDTPAAAAAKLSRAAHCLSLALSASVFLLSPVPLSSSGGVPLWSALLAHAEGLAAAAADASASASEAQGGEWTSQLRPQAEWERLRHADSMGSAAEWQAASASASAWESAGLPPAAALCGPSPSPAAAQAAAALAPLAGSISLRTSINPWLHDASAAVQDATASLLAAACGVSVPGPVTAPGPTVTAEEDANVVPASMQAYANLKAVHAMLTAACSGVAEAHQLEDGAAAVHSLTFPAALQLWQHAVSASQATPQPAEPAQWLFTCCFAKPLTSLSAACAREALQARVSQLQSALTASADAVAAALTAGALAVYSSTEALDVHKSSELVADSALLHTSLPETLSTRATSAAAAALCIAGGLCGVDSQRQLRVTPDAAASLGSVYCSALLRRFPPFVDLLDREDAWEAASTRAQWQHPLGAATAAVATHLAAAFAAALQDYAGQQSDDAEGDRAAQLQQLLRVWHDSLQQIITRSTAAVYSAPSSAALPAAYAALFAAHVATATSVLLPSAICTAAVRESLSSAAAEGVLSWAQRTGSHAGAATAAAWARDGFLPSNSATPPADGGGSGKHAGAAASRKWVQAHGNWLQVAVQQEEAGAAAAISVPAAASAALEHALNRLSAHVHMAGCLQAPVPCLDAWLLSADGSVRTETAPRTSTSTSTTAASRREYANWQAGADGVGAAEASLLSLLTIELFSAGQDADAVYAVDLPDGSCVRVNEFGHPVAPFTRAEAEAAVPRMFRQRGALLTAALRQLRLCGQVLAASATRAALASTYSSLRDHWHGAYPAGAGPEAPVLQAALDVLVWSHCLPDAKLNGNSVSSASLAFAGRLPDLWMQLCSRSSGSGGGGGGGKDRGAALRLSQLVSPTAPLVSPAQLLNDLLSCVDPIDASLAAPYLRSHAADSLVAHAAVWADAAPALGPQPLYQSTDGRVVALEAAAEEKAVEVTGLADLTWQLEALLSQQQQQQQGGLRAGQAAKRQAAAPAPKIPLTGAGMLTLQSPLSAFSALPLPSSVLLAELDVSNVPLVRIAQPTAPAPASTSTPTTSSSAKAAALAARNSALHLLLDPHALRAGGTAAALALLGVTDGSPTAAAAAALAASPLSAAALQLPLPPSLLRYLVPSRTGMRLVGDDQDGAEEDAAQDAEARARSTTIGSAASTSGGAAQQPKQQASGGGVMSPAVAGAVALQQGATAAAASAAASLLSFSTRLFGAGGSGSGTGSAAATTAAHQQSASASSYFDFLLPQ